MTESHNDNDISSVLLIKCPVLYTMNGLG